MSLAPLRFKALNLVFISNENYLKRVNLSAKYNNKQINNSGSRLLTYQLIQGGKLNLISINTILEVHKINEVY